MRTATAALLLTTAIAGPCSRPQETSSGSTGSAELPDPIAPLHAFEEDRRRATDFARLPPSDHALGPDPIAIRALPGADPPRLVGLLRGRDAIVLLDAALHELARAPAPALPTGLAIAADGEIVVSGEQAPTITRYTVDRDAFRASPGPLLGGAAYGLRDVAVAGGRRDRVAYAVDERGDRLFVMPLGRPPGAGKVLPTCAGPFRVAALGDRLVVDCLIDHALAVYPLDRAGIPGDAPRATIRHDGPIWGFAAAETRQGLLIAAGGVEDHPLDRTEGSFGFIDSFVFLYRLAPGSTQPERLAAVNVSELGVITPKAVLLQPDREGGATVTVAGYGGDRLATLAWRGGFEGAPAVTTRPIPPGVAALAATVRGLAFADPLLDAWIGDDVVPVPDREPPRRGSASLVGEALFFTHLMAPWNRTDGRLSRFTCETCHFEGRVDGRTHHTGRGDVHATTKPLLGLFNNRPHFSRALDPDLATMVNSEFRVAGAKSDHDPWFSAADTGLAWIPLLGVPAADLDALALRRALMTFLMDLTHRPNPAVLGRDHFDDRERRGAEAFARRCERCHEARLVTDAPGSRVSPARWEELVMRREGPIVWAATGYHRTGVEPYVHEQGARAPSLRRLHEKRPYFTDGSARSLRDVLARARFQRDAFWHDRAPEGAEALDDGEREALLSFLELL